MPRPHKQLSIGFLLADRFTLTAFASFVDVMRLSADVGDRSKQVRCKWAVLSHDMEPIRASCGLAVQPTQKMESPADFDYIVVVGGLVEHIEPKYPQFVRFLQTASTQNVPLIGLCTGSFIMHEAGLMDGYKCCVSWYHWADYLERFDGVEPISDRIFVVDRDRLTCSGGSSAAHLAAYIIDKHLGRKFARKSLSILMVDDVHDSQKSQPNVLQGVTTNDNVLRRAIVLMQQNLETGVRISEIAKTLNVSRRSLEGRFRRHLNASPSEVMTRLKIEKAKQLLANTKLNVSDISFQSGFCDASHLNKVFLRVEGCSPSKFRGAKQGVSSGREAG